MPVESLILRRCYPVPVTFADLRAAHAEMYRSDREYVDSVGLAWHSAIKEATGAVDEVYAVIDGHEVRVATADQHSINLLGGPRHIAKDIADLLIKADEAGYWERPHEVVHVLEERAISRRAVNLACGVAPDKAGAA